MSDKISPVKRELQEASESYRENIKDGLKSISDTLGKSGKNALIIGGVLAGGYLLYRLLAPSDDSTKVKKVKVEPSVHENVVYQTLEPTAFDKMKDRLMEEAMAFLLALAKEKLVQFMNDMEKKDDSK